MGSYKIHINSPISRTNGSTDQLREDTVKGNRAPMGVGLDLMGSEQWSILEKGGRHSWGRNIPQLKCDFNMEFEANEKKVAELRSCFAGVLAESVSASMEEFQQSFVAEGYHAISATSMEGIQFFSQLC